MPEDLFLQLLMKHSASRLRELGAEADEKIRQGQLERGYIDKALALKGDSESQRPARKTEPTPAAHARNLTVPKPGETKGPVRAIVAGEPDRTWMPSEVRDELANRFQLEVATNTVRGVMKRLLEDRVFARPDGETNGFKLASTNGSSSEPHVEATNSESGGYGRQDALTPRDGLR